MIHDLFAWLLATFVIDPFQADMAEKLRAARAPQAVVQQMTTCIGAATPVLIDRATSDWLWGTKTVISIATGITRPEAVLVEAVPSCGPAVGAIRPFLEGEGA